jgi:hypothetical protein
MLIFSCIDFTDEYHYYVAPELKPFVDNFYKEAKKRGLILPTDGLSVSLNDPDSGGNAGESLNGSFIVIIKPSFVRDYLSTGFRADSLYVEWVVFHELGHGLLYENHHGGESIMDVTAQNENIQKYSTIDAARNRMISELFVSYKN